MYNTLLRAMQVLVVAYRTVRNNKVWLIGSLIAVTIGALAYGSHESRMRGIAEERAHEAAQQAELHARAAAVALKAANAERKVQDSLHRILNHQDSVVQVRTQTELRTRRAYTSLRDSVLADTTTPPRVIRLIAKSDADKKASDEKAASLESKIGTLEADTASKARENLKLRLSIDERVDQIDYLNRQIDAQVQELKHTKRQGWVRTALAAGFGVVLGVASSK